MLLFSVFTVEFVCKRQMLTSNFKDGNEMRTANPMRWGSCIFMIMVGHKLKVWPGRGHNSHLRDSLLIVWDGKIAIIGLLTALFVTRYFLFTLCGVKELCLKSHSVLEFTLYLLFQTEIVAFFVWVRVRFLNAFPPFKLLTLLKQTLPLLSISASHPNYENLNFPPEIIRFLFFFCHQTWSHLAFEA